MSKWPPMNFDKLHLLLNFSQITSWSKPIQLGFCAACYLMLCLILYLFFYLPLNTRQHQNATFITQLTKEFNAKQQLIRSAKPIAQNQQTKTGLFEPKLQPQPLSQLLTQLVDLANENHLEFDTLKPLPSESTHNLQIQPIQLSTNGHFQQLLDFFSQLSHLDSMNTLGDFTIKPSLSATGDPVGTKILQLALILNVYSKANLP